MLLVCGNGTKSVNGACQTNIPKQTLVPPSFFTVFKYLSMDGDEAFGSHHRIAKLTVELGWFLDVALVHLIFPSAPVRTLKADLTAKHT